MSNKIFINEFNYHIENKIENNRHPKIDCLLLNAIRDYVRYIGFNNIGTDINFYNKLICFYIINDGNIEKSITDLKNNENHN